MLSKVYNGLVRIIEIMQEVQLERAKALLKYGKLAE